MIPENTLRLRRMDHNRARKAHKAAIRRGDCISLYNRLDCMKPTKKVSIKEIKKSNNWIKRVLEWLIRR